MSLRQQVLQLNETVVKCRDKELKLQNELTYSQERVAVLDAKYQEIKNDLVNQEKIIKVSFPIAES